jgi:hypothetical protein
MCDHFFYVHEALGLFSPEAGLDEATATDLLHYQLRVPVWREGFVNELTSMLSSDAIDWISVVDNSKFCMGEFETPDDARAFVIKLFAPFVPTISMRSGIA